MAGSEAFDELGIKGGRVPQVDSASALRRYQAFHTAAQKHLVKACHDLSDGGLAVALAEMCMGGQLGAKIDLTLVGREKDMTSMETLYSESASRFLVEVEPAKCAEFEALFAEHCYQIGEVGAADTDLAVYAGENLVLAQNIPAMTKAFKKTLNA